MELGGRSWLSASGTFGIRSGHTAAPSTSILAVAGKKPSSLASSSCVTSVMAVTPLFRASAREALLPAPVGADRFVIRATHEHGVGVRSSRSLATASREAVPLYGGRIDPAWTWPGCLSAFQFLHFVAPQTVMAMSLRARTVSRVLWAGGDGEPWRQRRIDR